MKTPFTSTKVLESAQTGGRHEQANRRRFTRYRTNLPVRVRDRQQRTHVGHCFVIAEGGLGATLPESISVGSIVQLVFALPSQATPLKVLALVRNQFDRQHGFEFLSLTDADRQSIKGFCNQLATDPRNADKWTAH
jgi:hypothetical protein